LIIKYQLKSEVDAEATKGVKDKSKRLASDSMQNISGIAKKNALVDESDEESIDDGSENDIQQPKYI
jgi:hypothetical protein